MKHPLRRFARLLATAALGVYFTANPLSSVAADHYLTGTITDITSLPTGLMVILDTGVPTNCTGSPYGCMLIPEANKTMVATALLMWTTGSRRVTAYTNATPAGSFCTINQFDPV